MKNKFIKFSILFTTFILMQLNCMAVDSLQQAVNSPSYDDIMMTAKEQQALVSGTSNLNTDVEVKTKSSETEAVTNITPESEIQNVAEQVEQDKTQIKTNVSLANIVFKFILALIWVAISSVIIFIILLSYKKLIIKNKPINPTYESLEHSLDTPKNFKEALKLFLDKTKWN